MTSARDVMHTGVECVGEHETLDAAAHRMRDLGVGSLPICGDDNKLRGIITDRDIVVKCLAADGDPQKMTAGELAQGKPFTATADTDIKYVLETMEDHQIRRLPVVNEDKQLVGMISEADLARNLPDREVGRFVEAVVARSV
ncbi:CBS domain-containing protein [Streptomyces chiangmaiensis]|uniref:CBS domain-containing protein n=1 Tax=Streptomyces chiangmaiensis TaxID=766497 RepID=A0ABU7FP38_9ACTN|nr:CBS domain-containing protein [Streptomyces chiangmaiensis]MED7825881.1 CBS domain-containing protein [Streptomyces chiangmaiensis]